MSSCMPAKQQGRNCMNTKTERAARQLLSFATKSSGLQNILEQREIFIFNPSIAHFKREPSTVRNVQPT